MHLSFVPIFLQVRASTASWVATLPCVDFSSVVMEETSIFLAFFESTSENKSAAAHALGSAHQVGSASMQLSANMCIVKPLQKCAS